MSMESKLHSKNTYMRQFKNKESIKKDEDRENFYVFDQAMRDKKGMGE